MQEAITDNSTIILSDETSSVASNERDQQDLFEEFAN